MNLMTLAEKSTYLTCAAMARVHKIGSDPETQRVLELLAQRMEGQADLVDAPVLGIQSVSVPPVVSTVPNDVFIRPEIRQ